MKLFHITLIILLATSLQSAAMQLTTTLPAPQQSSKLGSTLKTGTKLAIAAGVLYAAWKAAPTAQRYWGQFRAYNALNAATIDLLKSHGKNPHWLNIEKVYQLYHSSDLVAPTIEISTLTPHEMIKVQGGKVVSITPYKQDLNELDEDQKIYPAHHPINDKLYNFV